MPTAREATVQVGTTPWPTWTYDGRVPGPEIRLTRGDRVRIRLDNHLPQSTTIHWHGLVVPQAMDGQSGSAATVSLGMLVYTGYERSVAPPVVWPPELQAGRALRYADSGGEHGGARRRQSDLAPVFI